MQHRNSMSVIMQRTKQTVTSHCQLQMEQLWLQRQRRVYFESDY